MVGSSHSTERSKVHGTVSVTTVSDVSGTVSNTGGSASVVRFVRNESQIEVHQLFEWSFLKIFL